MGSTGADFTFAMLDSRELAANRCSRTGETVSLSLGQRRLFKYTVSLSLSLFPRVPNKQRILQDGALDLLPGGLRLAGVGLRLLHFPRSDVAHQIEENLFGFQKQRLAFTALFCHIPSIPLPPGLGD